MASNRQMLRTYVPSIYRPDVYSPFFDCHTEISDQDNAQSLTQIKNEMIENYIKAEKETNLPLSTLNTLILEITK